MMIYHTKERLIYPTCVGYSMNTSVSNKNTQGNESNIAIQSYDALTSDFIIESVIGTALVGVDY